MRISPTLGSVGSNRLSQYTQSVSAQTALSSPLSALRSHTHPELRSQITRPSHSPTRIPPSSTNTARHDDACTVAVAPPSAAAAEIQPSPRTTITATTLPPSLSLSLSLYSPAPLSPRSAASSPGWCGPPRCCAPLAPPSPTGGPLSPCPRQSGHRFTWRSEVPFPTHPAHPLPSPSTLNPL